MTKPSQAMLDWFNRVNESENLASAIQSFKEQCPDETIDNRFLAVASYFFCCGSANCMTRSEFDRLMGKDD